MRTYYTYILTNKRHTVLYIGVTNDIERRVFEHKSKINKSFTQKYNVSDLVYYEEFTDIRVAIAREKLLKKYKREWKENLINAFNPTWVDLAADWFDEKEFEIFRRTERGG
jgi:putative endonuclease